MTSGTCAKLLRAVARMRASTGIRTPGMRALAKPHRNDHALALALWRTGDRDARLLAAMVEDPSRTTAAQADAWVSGIEDWGLCDGCSFEVFRWMSGARRKAEEWAGREEEFVRRAGFATIAGMAVADRQAADEVFETFLPVIERHADDDRHYVKKAVNWSLRQIGKRNRALNRAAITTARRLASRRSPTSRWIARDALRELESPPIQRRLNP